MKADQSKKGSPSRPKEPTANGSNGVKKSPPKNVVENRAATTEAAEAPSAAPITSVEFRRQLVSFEESDRNEALDVLNAYLAKQMQSGDRSFVAATWKALYFAMWHADGVPVQQALAERLARYMVGLPYTWEFQRAFWRETAMQWHKLDIYRLDKYYYLMRQFVQCSIEHLLTMDFNKEEVKQFLDLMHEGPLDHSIRNPKGILLHIIDVYLDALKACPRSIPAKVLATLCEPMFVVAAVATEDSTVLRVQSMFLNRVQELENVSVRFMAQAVSKVLGDKKSAPQANRNILLLFLKSLTGQVVTDAKKVKLVIPKNLALTKPLEPLFKQMDAAVEGFSKGRVTQSSLRNVPEDPTRPVIAPRGVVPAKRTRSERSGSVSSEDSPKKKKKRSSSKSPSISPPAFTVSDIAKDQASPADVRWTPTPFVEYDVNDLPDFHRPACYQTKASTSTPTPTPAPKRKRNSASPRKSPSRSPAKTPINGARRHVTTRSVSKTVRFGAENHVRAFDFKTHIVSPSPEQTKDRMRPKRSALKKSPLTPRG